MEFRQMVLTVGDNSRAVSSLDLLEFLTALRGLYVSVAQAVRRDDFLFQDVDDLAQRSWALSPFHVGELKRRFARELSGSIRFQSVGHNAYQPLPPEMELEFAALSMNSPLSITITGGRHVLRAALVVVLLAGGEFEFGPGSANSSWPTIKVKTGGLVAAAKSISDIYKDSQGR